MNIKKVLTASVAGLALLAAYSASAAIVQQGSCGGRCTWTLDDQGYFSTKNGRSATGEFEIPEGTTKIAGSAFFGASGLTKITIPDGVTTIWGSAFYNTGLTGELILPDSVTTIGTGAFYNNRGVTSLTIPDSVTSIGNGAFENMSGVTGELKIPDSVTYIGNSAFKGMSGVTSVTISDSVKRIENNTFQDMSGVTGELVIPDSVTRIDAFTFSGMSGVTSLTIPDSVTTIGYNVFAHMDSLSEIYLSADSPLTDEMLMRAYIDPDKVVRYTADGQYITAAEYYAGRCNVAGTACYDAQGRKTYEKKYDTSDVGAKCGKSDGVSSAYWYSSNYWSSYYMSQYSDSFRPAGKNGKTVSFKESYYSYDDEGRPVTREGTSCSMDADGNFYDDNCQKISSCTPAFSELYTYGANGSCEMIDLLEGYSTACPGDGNEIQPRRRLIYTVQEATEAVQGNNNKNRFILRYR